VDIVTKCCWCRDRLSVGRLEDFALGRVVSEQFLDEVDVSEQHTAAAVARESQVVKRLSVHNIRQNSCSNPL